MPDKPSVKTDFRTEYDMNSPELAHRWDEVVEEMHDEHGGCPIARSEVGEGYWVLNTQEDVTRVNADWQNFSNATGFMPDRPKDMPYLYPEECDPPFQTQVRDGINPFFRPSVIHAQEPAIRKLALRLTDEIKQESEIEAIQRYCTALPGLVFCDAIAGMPTDAIDFLQTAFDEAILGPVEGRGAALQRGYDYIDDYMKQRQANPTGSGDLVEAIVNLDSELFDWEAKVGILTNLTIGGIGTTGFVFASALYYLVDKPELRRELGSDPDKMQAAVEEFIRFYAPSPHDGRRALDDARVGDVEVKKGEYVLNNYGAASRDPAVFECPHEVKLDRGLPNRHMAFGHGIHRCVGSHLARLELRIGIETFLTEIPEYSVPAGFEPEYEISATRVMKELPLLIGGEGGDR